MRKVLDAYLQSIEGQDVIITSEGLIEAVADMAELSLPEVTRFMVAKGYRPCWQRLEGHGWTI